MTSFLCDAQTKPDTISGNACGTNANWDGKGNYRLRPALSVTHLQDFDWNLGQEFLKLSGRCSQQPVQWRRSVQHELSHQGVNARKIKQVHFFLEDSVVFPRAVGLWEGPTLVYRWKFCHWIYNNLGSMEKYAIRKGIQVLCLFPSQMSNLERITLDTHV